MKKKLKAVIMIDADVYEAFKALIREEKHMTGWTEQDAVDVLASVAFSESILARRARQISATREIFEIDTE